MKNRLRKVFTTKKTFEYVQYVHTQWFIDPAVPIVLEEGIDVMAVHCRNNRFGKDMHKFLKFNIPEPKETPHNIDIEMRMPVNPNMYRSKKTQVIQNTAYAMKSRSFNKWITEVCEKITDARRCGVIYRFDGAVFGEGFSVDENQRYDGVHLDVVIPEIMHVFRRDKEKVSGMVVPPYLVTISNEQDEAVVVLHVKMRDTSIIEATAEQNGHIPVVDVYYNSDILDIDTITVSTAKEAKKEVAEKVDPDAMLIPPTYKLNKEYVTFHRGDDGLMAEKIGWASKKVRNAVKYEVVTEDMKEAIPVTHCLEPFKNTTPFKSPKVRKDTVATFNEYDAKEIAQKLTTDILSLKECSIIAREDGKCIFIDIVFVVYFYPRYQKITQVDPDIFYMSKVYEIGRILATAVKRRFDSATSMSSDTLHPRLKGIPPKAEKIQLDYAFNITGEE